MLDLIPAKYRKYVIYGLIPIAVLVYGAWQAADGDWHAFWPALGTALVGAVAHVYTDASDDPSDE